MAFAISLLFIGFALIIGSLFEEYEKIKYFNRDVRKYKGKYDYIREHDNYFDESEGK